MAPMTPEFWAIIAVGVSIAGLVAGSHWILHSDIGSLHRDMAALRERMAKLEGAMDGWTKAIDTIGGRG